MTVFLKAATAATVLIGPFVDNVDGYTPETALTITAAEVLISKNGGALAAKNEASAASHSSNGYYAVSLDTVDTEDGGALKIVVNESGAFPVWMDCAVLTADAWNALFDGRAMLANVSQWNGTNIAAPDTAGYPKVTIKDGAGAGELDTASGKVSVATGGITAGSFAAGAIDAAAIATGAIDADAIADSAIDAGAIATGAITAAKFAAGAIDAAAIATGAIDADALAADVVNDVFMGTALTEAYAADGSAATPAQLLYMIWALLAEKSVSGTTVTVKKLDGSTAAMTFTLNDGTNPTSITRAS